MYPAPAVSCLQDVPNGICSMTRQVLKLAITATVGCMPSTPILAQILPPAAKAAHVGSRKSRPSKWPSTILPLSGGRPATPAGTISISASCATGPIRGS